MATVLVTGTRRGIGLTFVKHLAQRGDTVYAGVRDPAAALELQQLAQQYPQQVKVVKLDVTSADDIASLKNLLGDQALDLLINNAGIYGPKPDPFGQTDEDAWLDTFRVNCIAPRRITEALIDNLARATNPKLVFISSKMGSMGDNRSGGAYIYRSSKAALNAIAKSMSHDLVNRGVITLILHPGWVLTDMGGPNAEISTDYSVTQMLSHIDRATTADNGRFIDIDGSTIPW